MDTLVSLSGDRLCVKEHPDVPSLNCCSNIENRLFPNKTLFITDNLPCYKAKYLLYLPSIFLPISTHITLTNIVTTAFNG